MGGHVMGPTVVVFILYNMTNCEFTNTLRKDMEEGLEQGYTYLVDRYAFSGVAYTVAKVFNLYFFSNQMGVPFNFGKE
jgi:thymidylate kinase